jgi:hypothetical protein
LVLTPVLPVGGFHFGLAHARQMNQYSVVIERPGGATGPLNNVDMRLTRPGLVGSISGDGRF